MARTPKAAPADEKVTINVGPVDLGKIDLLVAEGFYGSRTDFIRDAMRRLLEDHRRLLDDVVDRRELTIGYVRVDAAELEECRRNKQRLSLRVIGGLHLADDVPVGLADEVIASIWVLGTLRGPEDVLAALEDRTSGRGDTP